MSKYALELLSKEHDRKGFRSGMESMDQYLTRTVRGHLEKGVSVTRVLVESDAVPPKPIAGYFTLTPISVIAPGWPEVPNGLPRNPVGAILLGRMGVHVERQGEGIGARLLACARRISYNTICGSGGIGMVVDAADESLIPFYQKFGFKQVSEGNPLRLFLPTKSLLSDAD